MARHREFNEEKALESAMNLFLGEHRGSTT